MADLISSDGIPYSLRPYRDTVTFTSRRELLKHIEREVSKYGDYCHVRPRPSVGKGVFDIAISNTPGYLLGDAVYQYFNKPKDLIWCEETTNANVDESTGINEKCVAVVVIRDGRIELDANVPAMAVSSDIGSAIQQSSNPMTVYVHGDVPIVSPSHEAKITDVVIEESMVDQFIQLDEPVFPKLPCTESIRLKPSNLAIKDSGLSSPAPVFIAGATLVLLSTVAGFLYEPPNNKVVINDPFKEYRQALTSPAPAIILADIYKQCIEAISIPGFTPSLFEITTHSLKVTFPIGDGEPASLIRYAATQKGALTIEGRHIFIVIPLNSMPRSKPQNIANTIDVVSEILSVTSINSKLKAKVGSTTNHGSYRQASMSFSADKASFLDLVFLAKSLDGLPLTLSPSTVKFDGSALSGQLNFNVYGN